MRWRVDFFGPRKPRLLVEIRIQKEGEILDKWLDATLIEDCSRVTNSTLDDSRDMVSGLINRHSDRVDCDSEIVRNTHEYLSERN